MKTFARNELSDKTVSRTEFLSDYKSLNDEIDRLGVLINAITKKSARIRTTLRVVMSIATILIWFVIGLMIGTMHCARSPSEPLAPYKQEIMRVLASNAI